MAKTKIEVLIEELQEQRFEIPVEEVIQAALSLFSKVETAYDCEGLRKTNEDGYSLSGAIAHTICCELNEVELNQ